MTSTRAYAAATATSPLAPFTFQRRAPQPHDVAIDIQYCGICHSDIHQARDGWGGSIFPMVPGHEIVGVVSAVGDQAYDTRYPACGSGSEEAGITSPDTTQISSNLLSLEKAIRKGWPFLL